MGRGRKCVLWLLRFIKSHAWTSCSHSLPHAPPRMPHLCSASRIFRYSNSPSDCILRCMLASCRLRPDVSGQCSLRMSVSQCGRLSPVLTCVSGSERQRVDNHGQSRANRKRESQGLFTEIQDSEIHSQTSLNDISSSSTSITLRYDDSFIEEE